MQVAPVVSAARHSCRVGSSHRHAGTRSSGRSGSARELGFERLAVEIRVVGVALGNHDVVRHGPRYTEARIVPTYAGRQRPGRRQSVI